MTTKSALSLTMVLALLLGSAMLTGAAGQTEARAENTIKGTVERVMAQTGLLWATLDDGSRLQVAAPTKLLEGLQEGSEVAIRITKQDTESAAGEGASVATVQEIDSSTGLLRLLTAQEEIVDLRPPEEILADLQTGDRVQISVQETQQPQQTAEQQNQQQASGATSARVDPTQTSAMAMQDMPIAATVTQIDQQNQKLQLMTGTGNLVEFKVSESLLSTLQTGDSVEVAIHKESGGQGAQQPSQSR